MEPLTILLELDKSSWMGSKLDQTLEQGVCSLASKLLLPFHRLTDHASCKQPSTTNAHKRWSDRMLIYQIACR